MLLLLLHVLLSLSFFSSFFFFFFFCLRSCTHSPPCSFQTWGFSSSSSSPPSFSSLQPLPRCDADLECCCFSLVIDSLVLVVIKNKKVWLILLSLKKSNGRRSSRSETRVQVLLQELPLWKILGWPHEVTCHHQCFNRGR